MDKKYKQISPMDVGKVLVNISLDCMAPVDNITLVNIASLLKTSRYQVKKYMKLLVEYGVAEYSVQSIYSEDELLPPSAVS